MRIVFVGASRLAVQTAKLLMKHGHDVVMIEEDKDRLQALTESLGCGMIHGDGSNPAILRETDPANSDYLFCVTDNAQTNIIASLVGRSLGFRHVVTRIDDPEFEHICMELGLENTIIPNRTISRYLASIVEGQKPISLSALIKHDATLFSFVVSAQEVGAVSALALPKQSRLMLLYRGDKFILPDSDTELQENDEAVIVCHSQQLKELQGRWLPTDPGEGTLDVKAGK